jgi:voltage-gated potassium channel
MNQNRHLIVSITLSIGILIVGTTGYMIIEGWRFLDALYMTVITISTVGYREINQIGDVGRVFTILLVAIGVGFTLYVAAAIVQFMVEGQMRIILGKRRLDQKINRLKSRTAICCSIPHSRLKFCRMIRSLRLVRWKTCRNSTRY